MKINPDSPLVLSDLFLYDFESCYWNILKRLDYDLDRIPFEDKKKRNIAIGKLQQSNPRLAQNLYRIAEDSVSEFLFRNDVDESNIIVRQRDGVILSTPLRVNRLPSGLELKKRANLPFLIISSDRKKLLYKTDIGRIVVKGVSFVYEDIYNYYQKFSKLNFLSKKTLCIQLQKLKDGLRKEPVTTFCIPNLDESVSIFLVNEGQITLSKKAIRLISKKNIDFNRYFDHYFRPFCESIFLDVIRRKGC